MNEKFYSFNDQHFNAVESALDRSILNEVGNDDDTYTMFRGMVYRATDWYHGLSAEMLIRTNLRDIIYEDSVSIP